MKPIHKGKEIPTRIWVRAQLQWIPRFFVRLLFSLVGLLIAPICLALAKTYDTNAFGEPRIAYDLSRYPGADPEGSWEFHSLPTEWKHKWPHRLLWLFGNDEDGYYGDRYGMWSQITDQKTRSWLSQYRWAFLRNRVNNLSRYTSWFSIDVNECDIEYWGSYFRSEGPYMVRATHRDTGRTVYGYGNKPKGVMIGFKVYPRHGSELESVDDKDRGFTYRPF